MMTEILPLKKQVLSYGINQVYNKTEFFNEFDKVLKLCNLSDQAWTLFNIADAND